MVSHMATEVSRPDTLVIRLGSESTSIVVTIRRPAYFGSLKIAAIGSMYCVLYLSISVGPSSPLEASAEQSRPGRL